MWIFILNLGNIFTFYTELFSNKDKHYKINRDNVRVRLSPNKENNKNILTKLPKNTYIEKIGEKNGWINIKFDLEDGNEKNGLIYRNMLTKIED